MRNVTELLVSYAHYHRDRRNIATHMLGIPLIVFAVGVLLARPGFQLGGLALSPAWLLCLVAGLWYLSRDLVLGGATAAVSALLFYLAAAIAPGDIGHWLGWGLGSFVVGWIIQFVGHYYEGRKPAFVDDIMGLLIGPMFVVAEVLFALGWNKALAAEVERQAGPTRLRDLAHPA